MPIHKLLNLKF